MQLLKQQTKRKSAQAAETGVGSDPWSSMFFTGEAPEQNVAALKRSYSAAFPAVWPESRGKLVVRASDRIEKLTPEELQINVADMQEDIRSFGVRLQRLDLRILTNLLSGNFQILKNPGEAFTKRIDAITKTLDACRPGTRNLRGKINSGVYELNQVLALKYPLRPELVEGVGDMRLLQKLIRAALIGEEFSPVQKNSFFELRERVAALSSMLSGASRQGELFEGFTVSARRELVLKEGYEEYRRILRDVADIEEKDSWCSPTYGSGGKGQCGPGQKPEPKTSDYQRSYMPELARFELTLKRYSGIRWGAAETVLFNNGLAAFNGVLSAVTAETRKSSAMLQSSPVFLKSSDLYFEVDGVLERHCRQSGIALRQLDGRDTRSMVEAVMKEWPGALFIAPFGNSYDQPACEVTRILRALSSDKVIASFERKHPGRLADRKFSLVIDNTVAGTLAKWRSFNFNRLPSFIQVFSVESLLKFAQDGLETTPAGLVAAIGEEAASRIHDARKMQGAYPPETVLRRLVTLEDSVDLVEKRMHRLSRNANCLALSLEKAAALPGSILLEVHYPGLKGSGNSEIAQKELTEGGAILNVGINYERVLSCLRKNSLDDSSFNSSLYNITRAYMTLAMKLAAESGVEINQGASFGFNTTRMSVCDRFLTQFQQTNDLYKIPYIRISSGTENLKDVALIGNAFVRASEIFAAAAEQDCVASFARSLLPRAGSN